MEKKDGDITGIGKLKMSAIQCKGRMRQSLPQIIADPENTPDFLDLSADEQKVVIDKSKRVKKLQSELLDITSKGGKNVLINHINKTLEALNTMFDKVSLLIKDDKIIDKLKIRAYLSRLVSLKDGIGVTEDEDPRIIVEDLVPHYYEIIFEM
ncbi:MAG: hypothetical protein HQL90_16230, partial [Magnetococcales bacterium]|nr:hypothetical protein [Magnetococcales bacterium]